MSMIQVHLLPLKVADQILYHLVSNRRLNTRDYSEYHSSTSIVVKYDHNIKSRTPLNAHDKNEYLCPIQYSK